MDFKHYIDTLNSHHDSKRVNCNLQVSNIEFLDTEDFIIKDAAIMWTLGTSVVFLYPQDTRALLHTNSFHQTHTFKGIVKSQLIRFHRICIRQHDVDRATTTLFGAFQKKRL